MQVYVHLAKGFEEIEAITVIDVLRRGGIDCKTVSVEEELIVTGAHEISVKADLLYDQADYEECTMIVLPGGMPGTTNLSAHQGLIEQIKKFAITEKWIAAICAAPMIFGGLGLLEGKMAVIYPGMEGYLTGAKVGRNNVAIDGNIITSRGIGAALEFALVLVEILKDKSTAMGLKSSMVIQK